MDSRANNRVERGPTRTNDMIYTVTFHPHYVHAQACETLACKWRAHRIAACQGCAHRWQREASEDRKRRQDKDLLARAER
jgi:hypothetical protein